MTESISNPKVSIVIATYNSEKYLPYLFESLLYQEGIQFKEIEIIFVDGNSSDSTIDLLYDFMNKYKEIFYDIKVIRHDRNYGVSKARNDGIKVCKGEYVLILDSDVILPRDGLYRLLDFIEKSDDPSLVGVKALHLRPESISGKLTLDRMIYCKYIGRISECYLIADATLLKKTVFENVGLYREDMGPPFSSSEQYELGMRIKRKGYKVVVLGDLIAIHKPITSYNISSKETLYSSIKRRIREYFSLNKAIEITKVLESMPTIDKLQIYATILFINTVLSLFIYGLIFSLHIFILISSLLFLILQFSYIIYSLIFFKGCNISHRLISGIFIINSRILRYLVVECFYFYKIFKQLIKIISFNYSKR